MGAEAQALRDGLGQLHWVARILGGRLEGRAREPRDDVERVRKRGSVAVLDAKSVYVRPRSPGSSFILRDKFPFIDVAIAKDAIRSAATIARWAPSAFQLADCLARASADSCDTLRGMLRRGAYRLQDEAEALKIRSAEKERRRIIVDKNKARNEKMKRGKSGARAKE